MSDAKPSITEVWEAAGGTIGGMGLRSGWVKAQCFMHDDRTASASINEDECSFHCFACDKHGDSWDLIMAWQHLDFLEAKEYGKRFTASNVEAQPAGPSSSIMRKPNKVKSGKGFVPSWKL